MVGPCVVHGAPEVPVAATDLLEARRAQTVAALCLHRIAKPRQTHRTLVLVLERWAEVCFVASHVRVCDVRSAIDFYIVNVIGKVW